MRVLIIYGMFELRRNDDGSAPTIQKAPGNMLQDAKMPEDADGMLNARMMKSAGCHSRAVRVDPIVISIQQEES